MIKLKRIYDKAETGDGLRILVDRLWPRGMSKTKAKVDLWLKDLAPTYALRKWFNHEPKKWPEFQKRYKAELKQNKAATSELRKLIKIHKIVTLLYGAKDTEHNQAVVIKNVL